MSHVPAYRRFFSQGSCTNPLLQPGQQNRLAALRLLSALQAHGDLLVTPCKGKSLPQPGWKKNPNFVFASSAKVSTTQSLNISLPQNKEKPFSQWQPLLLVIFCHAFKSSDSIHVGVFSGKRLGVKPFSLRFLFSCIPDISCQDETELETFQLEKWESGGSS